MFAYAQQTNTDTVIVVPATEPGADLAASSTMTEVAHAPAKTGMPQLDTTTFANQIFWLILALGLLYWILSRIALPRIAGVLADRQGAITGDLGAAEEFKRRARDAEAAYDRALAEARGQAQGIVGEHRAAVQKDLDVAIAHADAEITARTAESEGRIAAIRDRAADDARSVARDVTEELLRRFGGRAGPAEIAAALDSRLKGANP